MGGTKYVNLENEFIKKKFELMEVRCKKDEGKKKY